MDKNDFYGICDWFGLTKPESDFVWEHRPFDGEIIPAEIGYGDVEDLVKDLAKQIIRTRNAANN